MINVFRLLSVLAIGLFTANVANAAVVTGNQNANITVTEFFDYQCPHCRIMSRNIEQAMHTNQNVQVVSRVVPVIDGSSWFIARAALASRNQRGYHKFNRLLMEQKGYISKEQTMELAKFAGLDIKRLQQDMRSPAISSELAENLKASQAENVTVVPAVFITRKTANRPPIKIIGDRTVANLQQMFHEL